MFKYRQVMCIYGNYAIVSSGRIRRIRRRGCTNNVFIAFTRAFLYRGHGYKLYESRHNNY